LPRFFFRYAHTPSAGLRSRVQVGKRKTVSHGRFPMDPGRVGGQFAAGAGVEQTEFLQQLPDAFNITSGRVTEPQEIAALIAHLLSDVAGTSSAPITLSTAARSRPSDPLDDHSVP
jgi:hypothetical protein